MGGEQGFLRDSRIGGTWPAHQRLALRYSLWLAGLLGLSVPAAAQSWSFSGFASLVLGRSYGDCVSNASMASAYDGSCTRFIADWTHAGVYTDSLSAAPESRVGLQGTLGLTPAWSLTGQITSRPSQDQGLNLEWLYVSYQLTPELSLQLGRKRLPLYYYSDFEDVGYAYNTMRPSPDVYGWELVNYNGASLSLTRTLDNDWTLRAELLAGSEDSADNRYMRLISDTPQTIQWHRILGVNVELDRDWFSARLSYLRSDFEQLDGRSGLPVPQPSGRLIGPQSFLGLALNADLGPWILRSEWGSADRSSLSYSARFYLATAGYRVGDCTLTAGLSAYHEDTDYPQAYVPVRDRSSLLALRYEIRKGAALKLQWDRLADLGQTPFAGNARVLSASYDLVF